MTAPTPTLTIHPQTAVKTLGDLFGIFYEDINHAADGGLYAELVQNRSFEFDPMDNPDYHALTAWEKVERGGSLIELHVETHHPLHPNNPHYLVLEVLQPGLGGGVCNRGYNSGMTLRKGEQYRFSCFSKQLSSYSGKLQVRLENQDGGLLGEACFLPASGQWSYGSQEITCTGDTVCGRLVICATEKTTVALDMISLFPNDVFKGRTNGMRRDIAEKIAAMKPRFMRFPGGCLVHCGSLDKDDRMSMYRWKNTIGPVWQRPARCNKWGYHQSLGIGFYEYFQFCEDIGAKPLPVLPAGYDPHKRRSVPLAELEPWIQDALDLIEYATGPVDSVWGAKRAQAGHPEPFDLEYLGIGNEEVGQDFFDRYALFHQRIRERYPHIKLINSSGPNAAGSELERGWASARDHGSDLVDEHYYQSPAWFLANIQRYFSYNASGPKVFLGEYGTWGSTWWNALVEAAYMLHMEKAPAVALASYAPLLCNADYINWQPNLIWFDGEKSYGTSNYHVQKLFMNHQGDRELLVEAVGLEPGVAPISTIRGEIRLCASLVNCSYQNILLENLDTGRRQNLGDQRMSPEEEDRLLVSTAGENFRLSFDAVKEEENNDYSCYGERGFVLRFGYQNGSNYLDWKLGGWQNQDAMVGSVVDGLHSDLTQSLFTTKAERYHCELEVCGRSVITRVNGAVVNKAIDHEQIIWPLYYAASQEVSSKELILKVANLQSRSVQVRIAVAGQTAGPLALGIFEMACDDLSAANSREAPNVIEPTEHEVTVMVDENSNFYWDFPASSITILRM